MNCRIKGCPGQYEKQYIVHTVKTKVEVLVFENVPAEVCDVCSDTLLEPDTIRNLERLMKKDADPKKLAPVYEYDR